MTPTPGEDDSDDDGIVLDAAVFKTDEVRQLESDPSYQKMARQTVKARKKDNRNNNFKRLRAVIRSSAAAARKAYAVAAQAQPDTPRIADFLQVSGRYTRCLKQVSIVR